MSLEAFNITNWRKHPTESQYWIFFYNSLEEGDYLEKLLKENSIWYEKSTDQDSNRHKSMFAVRNRDIKEVRHLNNLTIGKFRKPFIANKMLRFLLLVVSFVVLGLGIIGYLQNG